MMFKKLFFLVLLLVVSGCDTPPAGCEVVKRKDKKTLLCDGKVKFMAVSDYLSKHPDYEVELR